MSFFEEAPAHEPVLKPTLVRFDDPRPFLSDLPSASDDVPLSIFVDLWCDPVLGTPVNLMENRERIRLAREKFYQR